MNLQEPINQGESKRVEFKEKLPKNESIVKTIISFSNTSGGKLIIGVSDAREAIGIEDENIFELQDKISSLIFDSCYPNILPEIYTLNLEGKLLLVIEVFRGNLLPYYLKFGFLKQMSHDLMIEFPEMKGFSKRNLELIRKWYLFYSQDNTITKQAVSQLVQIPWGIILLFFKKIVR